MAIPFVKMHGLGNDYVYLDAVACPELDRREDLPALARAISDRHRGVGADGLILVALPTPEGAQRGAHARMRMFNADGSEAEMCGNGVRCVAKFAHDRLGLRERPLRVETGRGVLTIGYRTERVHGAERLVEATVDMGAPGFGLATIDRAHARVISEGPGPAEIEIDLPDARARRWRLVSMGNPHAVAFLDEPPESLAELARQWGPRVERHPAFPARTNVHFARIESRTHAIMHTWERGTGITQACGTGACAVAVAGVHAGMLDAQATLTLPGGDLRIAYERRARDGGGAGRVLMTGPAADVCEGVWPEPGDGATVAPIFRGPQPSITTDRLVLRPMRLGDAPAIAALAGDRRIYEYTLLIPHPYREEHATGWIATHRRGWEAGQHAHFAITLRQTGELVGGIGLVGISAIYRHAEVGYWIGVPHWSRGYATEAAGAVVEFGLGTLGLHRVSAFYFPGNEASGRVLEKIGMRREGVCRQDRFKDGKSRDSVLLAALAGEAGNRPRISVVAGSEGLAS